MLELPPFRLILSSESWLGLLDGDGSDGDVLFVKLLLVSKVLVFDELDNASSEFNTGS